MLAEVNDIIIGRPRVKEDDDDSNGSSGSGTSDENDGTLILDVCENYADKGVVGSFLRICKEFGMDIKETQVTVFEQANVRL